jgi:hypothetical protein
MASSKEEKTIFYKFANGVEMKGSFEQIAATAKMFGEKIDGTKVDISSLPSGYYPSESKGLIKISDMSDYHIRRALLKRAKEYFGTIYNADDNNSVFLNKFVSLSDDSLIIALYNELAKRK